MPRRLAILGGGYIATELAHVFDAMGSEVTMLVRGPRMLRQEDEEVSLRFTEVFAERCEVMLGASVDSVHRVDGELCIESAWAANRSTAGRRDPRRDRENSDDRRARSLQGRHRVPRRLRHDRLQDAYECRGVWALGDITNPTS